MTEINIKSIKGLGFFSKKERKIDTSEVLIKIIDKIKNQYPEKTERLEDLKIDIEEKIPLTNEKKAYLKKEIDLFKNIKNNSKQQIKSQEIRQDLKIPEYKKTISIFNASLITLEQTVKIFEEKLNFLYQETNTVNDKEKNDYIEKQNNALQKNLRSILSNLHMANSEILNQISKTKSIQTKMVILGNELDMKRNELG